MMKLNMILLMGAALATIGTTPVWADIDGGQIRIDESVHINEHCEHDCHNSGDIHQEATASYSESHDGHDVTDVLNFYGKHLHGHKITFEVKNLDTGAELSYDQSGYDEYTAIFHWYDGKFPLGSSYTACLHDHKTDDQSCKTKSHQENPDEITVDND